MEQNRCLYEVLGVERRATAEEIRSAYRREALLWHPDKIHNTGISSEEANQRFQAISNAYEVLSDPLERKWYDLHRSEILIGKAYGQNFDLDLWSYFSRNVYSGYGDTEKGFYAVYANVFSMIHLQEEMFLKTVESITSVREAPAFGGSTSPYCEVSVFYNYWLEFRTVKDFAWCDEHNVADALNRYTRRHDEKINKKLRERGQRNFNETVRQLAAFVKKRDKRVLERRAEIQRITKQKEMEHKLKREMEHKLRQEERKKAREEMAEDYEEVQVDENNECECDDNSRNKELYCICCEKRFRSQKQWENHEKSRKHRMCAATMKHVFAEMLAGEQHVDGVDDEDSTEEKVGDEGEGEGEQAEYHITKCESEIEVEQDEDACLAAMMKIHEDVFMNKECETEATLEEFNVENDDGKQRDIKGKKGRRKGKKEARGKLM